MKRLYLELVGDREAIITTQTHRGEDFPIRAHRAGTWQNKLERALHTKIGADRMKFTIGEIGKTVLLDSSAEVVGFISGDTYSELRLLSPNTRTGDGVDYRLSMCCQDCMRLALHGVIAYNLLGNNNSDPGPATQTRHWIKIPDQYNACVTPAWVETVFKNMIQDPERLMRS